MESSNGQNFRFKIQNDARKSSEVIFGSHSRKDGRVGFLGSILVESSTGHLILVKKPIFVILVLAEHAESNWLIIYIC